MFTDNRDALSLVCTASCAGIRLYALCAAVGFRRHFARIPAVAQCFYYFFLSCAAAFHRAGISLHASLRAGGLRRHFARIPAVGGFHRLIAHRCTAKAAHIFLYTGRRAGGRFNHNTFPCHVLAGICRYRIRILFCIVAAAAGMLRIAICRAGRLYHRRHHIVAQRFHFFFLGRVALAAGIDILTSLGAGGCSGRFLVQHPLVFRHFAQAGVFRLGRLAHRAGIQHVLSLTVVHYDAVIPGVAQGFGLFLLGLLAAAALVGINAAFCASGCLVAFQAGVQLVVMAQRIAQVRHLARSLAADRANQTGLHRLRTSGVNHGVHKVMLAGGLNDFGLCLAADGAGIQRLAGFAAGGFLHSLGQFPGMFGGNDCILRNLAIFTLEFTQTVCRAGRFLQGGDQLPGMRSVHSRGAYIRHTIADELRHIFPNIIGRHLAERAAGDSHRSI